jgi:predicted nucleotidyltransferase component of viral defense system
VKKPSPANLPASVHQRLLNRARETHQRFNDLLQHFAMERFLYRLSRSEYADCFVLKGALMLTVWHAPQSRPTMDIDLLGLTNNSVEEMVTLIQAICQQEVEPDGIAFEAATVVDEQIAEEAEYEGVRLRFKGSLGNAKLTMQVDIGFGDVMTPPAEVVEYPTLLDFPAPRLRGYSRESAVAEKFHVMIGRGLLTSRMKDFFDMWLLSRHFDFDGDILAKAIRATFARRNTAVDRAPEILSASFAEDTAKITQWQAFLRRSRLTDAPQNLTEAVAHLAVFLGPVIEALSEECPFKKIWKAPGPWSPHAKQHGKRLGGDVPETHTSRQEKVVDE